MLGVCKFISNQKKGTTAAFGGYQYNYTKSCKEKKHWRCVQYHLNRCSGRLTTVGEEVLKTNDHGHLPDERISQIYVAKSELRMQAVQSNAPPRRIIRATTAAMSTTAAVEMVKYESLARNIRRVRRNANPTPPVPKDLSELVLDGEFILTVKNDPFLLYDNKDSNNRIVIFTTRDNLAYMVHCEDLYVDGTFDVTPPGFKQVYTMHARRNECHLPLVYALACRKDYFTYELIFHQLKLAEPRLKPPRIMMDFEMAAIKAAIDVFGDVEVSGCFFHFCQSIYRHIQACGLQKEYNENPTFALHMRCLASLAFVPVCDVVRHFETLKTFDFFKKALEGKTNVDKGVREMLLYMETTWIGTKGRNSYKPGYFRLELWNVYETTLNNFPRTNNAVEAWHNAIKFLFGINHPDIFKFIRGIKLEQDATEVTIAKMFAQHSVSSVNKKYAKVQERLLKGVKSYANQKTFVLEKYLIGMAQSVLLSK